MTSWVLVVTASGVASILASAVGIGAVVSAIRGSRRSSKAEDGVPSSSPRELVLMTEGVEQLRLARNAAAHLQSLDIAGMTRSLEQVRQVSAAEASLRGIDIANMVQGLRQIYEASYATARLRDVNMPAITQDIEHLLQVSNAALRLQQLDISRLTQSLEQTQSASATATILLDWLVKMNSAGLLERMELEQLEQLAQRLEQSNLATER